MHLVLFEYLLRLFLYLLGVFSRPYIKIGDRELPTNLSLSYQNKKTETVDLRHLVSLVETDPDLLGFYNVTQ